MFLNCVAEQNVIHTASETIINGCFEIAVPKILVKTYWNTSTMELFCIRLKVQRKRVPGKILSSYFQ